MPDGIFTAFLLGVPALFAIVNPIGSALIFSQMLAHRTHAERSFVARKVATYAFAVLVVSFWIGATVLGFFGISLVALRLAGGLIVAHQAWVLLTAPGRDPTTDDAALADSGEAAFFPLTVPITTGPGTISVTIALAASKPADAAGGFAFAIGFTLAAVLIAVAVWLANRYIDVVLGVLGRPGASILMRLSAFILLCVGIQIMVDGVRGLIVAPA